MFPLIRRQLIRGVKEHIAAGLLAAADYKANYDLFYIPFDGVVKTYQGEQGGNWLRLTRDDNGDRIEFAHLSFYEITEGRVREGQPAGITGNSGTLTTGPHFHLQIINKLGKRLDPETYNWNPMFKIKLVSNVAWNINRQVKEFTDILAQYSGLSVVIDIQQTNFRDIPFMVLDSATGQQGIEESWFDKHVTPLGKGYDIVMFWMNADQWPAQTARGWRVDRDQGPIEIQVSVRETEISGRYPSWLYSTEESLHEIAHALFLHTGQEDLTHEYFYTNRAKELFTLINYSLLTKKPMNDHVKILNYKGTVGIFIAAEDIEQLQALGKAFGRPVVVEAGNVKNVDITCG